MYPQWLVKLADGTIYQASAADEKGVRKIVAQHNVDGVGARIEPVDQLSPSGFKMMFEELED